MMRRMRVTCSAMPPRIVTAPPDRPVPAPRGTTGMRCLPAILITSDTCCVVEALENRLLDSVVRRDLDREPDRKAVGGDCVMGFVHLAVDGQAERLRLCRGAQAGRLALDVHLVRPL